MKKLLIMILALSMALAFASCGEEQVYKGFYTVDVPKGFTWDKSGQYFTHDNQLINVAINSKSAETLFEEDHAFWYSSTPDYDSRGEDVTFEDYTWTVQNYNEVAKEMGSPSMALYMNSPEKGGDLEGKEIAIEITLYNLDLSDEGVIAFLESIKFVDNPYTSYLADYNEEEVVEEGDVYDELFTAEAPADFTWEKNAAQFERYLSDKKVNQIIRVRDHSGSLEEGLDTDRETLENAVWGDSVEYGDYTWEVATYIYGETIYNEFYTAFPSGDGYATVHTEGIDEADPLIVDFLKSIKFVDKK